jgi:hypothetical protein
LRAHSSAARGVCPDCTAATSTGAGVISTGLAVAGTVGIIVGGGSMVAGGGVPKLSTGAVGGGGETGGPPPPPQLEQGLLMICIVAVGVGVSVGPAGGVFVGVAVRVGVRVGVGVLVITPAQKPPASVKLPPLIALVSDCPVVPLRLNKLPVLACVLPPPPTSSK